MRHGQGWHSIGEEGHSLRDPELTPKGREQCADRCEAFERHDKIELLLASPLRRALQTCLLTFEPCVRRGVKIIALPIAEESSSAPSDTGSEPEVLTQEFPDVVDFDAVKHGWWVHEGEYATDPKSLNDRAARLRRYILARPEREVALVSHGFFNHYITGDVNEQGEQTTPWWNEAELRTFTFVDGDERAMIEETEESLKRRGAKRDGLIINNPAKRG